MKKDYLIYHNHGDYDTVCCSAKSMETAKKLFKEYVKWACWNYGTEVLYQTEVSVTFKNKMSARISDVWQISTKKELWSIGFSL